MSIRFSTHDLAPHDRVPYWMDVASKAFFVHDMMVGAAAFDGALKFDRMGGIGISTCVCGPCKITRTRQDIARDSIDDYILGIRLEGRTVVEQDGWTTMFEPGTAVLHDTARPLSAEYLDHSKSLYFMIPRKAIEARLGTRVRLTKRISENGAVAGVMSDFLRSLAARVDDLGQEVHGRLGEQAVDLIALGFVEPSDINSHSTRATTLLRLKSEIDTRLADPALRPSNAAAAAGISIRYANALLAEEGSSLERYILQRRLERCRGALQDPRQRHRMIGDIALSWGFSDHSHFTRRFRDTFGMTPGECRKMADDANVS